MIKNDIFQNTDLKSLPNEVWKDIPNYEGFYQASSLGRIRSLERTIVQKNGIKVKRKKLVLKQSLNHGYCQIYLTKNNIKKTRKTHQLVAIVFLKHKPKGHKIVVDHINNIKTDNRVCNLQLITQRENAAKDSKGSSKYTGVSWNKLNKKWQAHIKINGKTKYLGLFENEDEAREYYKNALERHKKREKIVIKKPLTTSRYKNVSWNKEIKKWEVAITVKGNRNHLGYYDLEIDAANAITKFKNEQIAII